MGYILWLLDNFDTLILNYWLFNLKLLFTLFENFIYYISKQYVRAARTLYWLR